MSENPGEFGAAKDGVCFVGLFDDGSNVSCISYGPFGFYDSGPITDGFFACFDQLSLNLDELFVEPPPGDGGGAPPG